MMYSVVDEADSGCMALGLCIVDVVVWWFMLQSSDSHFTLVTQAGMLK